MRAAPRFLPWAALLGWVVLVAPGCRATPPSAVPVAGKTVYRGMGVEDATVTATRSTTADGSTIDRTSSGYHGSFLLHLPPGTYRLRAVGTLPGPRGDRTLAGSTTSLEVPPGVRRLDRIVIPLKEVSGLPPKKE